MSKNKFESLLTLNGKELLSKRAENLGIDVEESFNEQKRVLNKRLRNLESEVFKMEDMSVKTTDSFIKNRPVHGIHISLNRKPFKDNAKMHNTIPENFKSQFLQNIHSACSITTACAMPGTVIPSLKETVESSAPVGTNNILFSSPRSSILRKYALSVTAEQPQPEPPAPVFCFLLS